MFKLNPDQLRKADIILIRHGDSSDRIMNLMNSKYSHCILYLGEHSCIEADGLGVHAQNIGRIIVKEKDDICVLRYKGKLSTILIEEITNYARSKTPTEYSLKEARKALRSEKDNSEVSLNGNRQFCTRLIAESYQYANISIVENPQFCTVKSFEDSSFLVSVDVEKLFIDANHLSFLNSNDILTEQRDVTNDLFDNIRKLTGEDIQTFEHINSYLLSHPDCDGKFTRILKKTGYLTLIDQDIKTNPEMYDFSLFKKAFPNKKESIYLSKILMQEETLKRFHSWKARYSNLYQKCAMTYFKEMKDLYTKLFEIDLKKKEIAIKILKENEALLSRSEVGELNRRIGYIVRLIRP